MHFFEEHEKKQIRPIAICLFRKNGRILVAEGYDSVKGETFYRPLGGGIEFGERSEDALRREMREEINADVSALHYLGVLENIFVFNGKIGHEIVLVYEGELIPYGLYDQAVILGKESNGEGFHVMWKSLNEFREGKSILYPSGLLELLSA